MASIVSTSSSREARMLIGGESTFIADVCRLAAKSLTDDVSVEPDRSRGVGLAIDALDFTLKAGKEISSPLEDFEIVDHRPRPVAKPLARNDCRNAGRVNDK